MQAIHAARLAIFNGETEMCEQLLVKSNEFIMAAENDASLAKTHADLIPIDGRLTFGETLVPTEESAKFIEKANEHFRKGEPQQGIEQLKLGDIDVAFARVLMPLQSTKKQLAEALMVAKQQKYYEANLALKKSRRRPTIRFGQFGGSAQRRIECRLICMVLLVTEWD
jgi:hypothetical protein